MMFDFYSRPCGRGDSSGVMAPRTVPEISTHAPAGGATKLHKADASVR